MDLDLDADLDSDLDLDVDLDLVVSNFRYYFPKDHCSHCHPSHHFRRM